MKTEMVDPIPPIPEKLKREVKALNEQVKRDTYRRPVVCIRVTNDVLKFLDDLSGYSPGEGLKRLVTDSVACYQAIDSVRQFKGWTIRRFVEHFINQKKGELCRDLLENRENPKSVPVLNDSASTSPVTKPNGSVSSPNRTGTHIPVPGWPSRS